MDGFDTALTFFFTGLVGLAGALAGCPVADTCVMMDAKAYINKRKNEISIYTCYDLRVKARGSSKGKAYIRGRCRCVATRCSHA